MKKYLYTLFLILLLVLPVCFSKAQTSYLFDPSIQRIVDSVKTDTLWKNLTSIQTIQRYTKNSASQTTADFFKNYFKSMGFDTVYLQNFTIPSTSFVSPNIIAVKYGDEKPDSIFLACGHWDVYASMAPGSDDNGSGTVSVLEAARVLANYKFKKTLKFCLVSGEEQGLYGSEAFVNTIGSTDRIGAALNLDMVSYQQSGQPLRIGMFPKSGTTVLYNKALALQQLYVPGIEVRKDLGCSYDCTDIYSFWNAGYDGLFFTESYSFGNYETPYYHTSNDLINTSANSKDKLSLTTKIVVACLATWAELSTTISIAENTNIIFNSINFPNPFTGITEIKYSLSRSSDITITITNVFGKQVAKLIDNEFIYEGEHSVIFDASGLSSGIYFYQLQSDNNSVTGKMMLINSSGN
jgi:aminopeptidase YwaD